MQTKYVPHYFGELVIQKLSGRVGWLTAGVASSIPWPKLDVWVQYGGDDYILRGTELNGKQSPPCITVPCDSHQVDEVLAKVYRFTSILSWYLHGYVDVSGYVSGSHPMLYGDPIKVYSELGIYGSKSFSCNHMPIIKSENVRKALAFWREGQRLRRVHSSYAFLSFYKVIESQFSKPALKIAWINENLDKLTAKAARRVLDLQGEGIDVSKHLFESGRCAVAHATLEGEIVDPDIPADRRRLTSDMDIMEQLAERYIRCELKVPNERTLYESRNRLEPWEILISPENLAILKNGETPSNFTDLDNLYVSVGLWPDGPILGLENMIMHVDVIERGVVKIVLFNNRKTVFLVFFLDFVNGRLHANLEDGGLCKGDNDPNEDDVRSYYSFFYYLLWNGIAELTCNDIEPIDCEVIIPVNIIPQNPIEAIEKTISAFRLQENKSKALKLY
ncbi:methylamine utilization protein MauJ [Methylotenera versatilis]|uniref:methylamine utilization protein MauJ n=1 Tax=Methylotenera versatilis TaxID=1055487 RepID=UPI0006461539|nr:methylamine utilization protein MauJ [Methylotenera versatilis]